MAKKEYDAKLVKLLAFANVPPEKVFKAEVGDIVVEASDPYNVAKRNPLDKIGYLCRETKHSYVLLTFEGEHVTYKKSKKPMFKVLVQRRNASLVDIDT